MLLLIDALSSASPGAKRQRGELVHTLLKHRPEGGELVIIAPPDDEVYPSHEALTVMKYERPRARWLGQWLYYNVVLPRVVRQQKPDVFYSLNGLRPMFLKVPTVISVNNMLPFAPDVIRMYPKFSLRWWRLWALRKLQVRSVRAADGVVLFAHHGIDKVARFAGEDQRTKMHGVVYGIPSDFQFDSKNPPAHPYEGKPYFFYLSALYPYKNHIRLVDAYARALKQDDTLPELLIAGIPDSSGQLENIEARIREHGLGDRTRYIGMLDREDIPAWLHHATVNVFASLIETNSFVTVETIGVGGVLAATAPASPYDAEGGYACEPFDPTSADDMARVMLKLWHDPERREELRKLSRTRATQLTWDQSGKTIWDAAKHAV